MEEWFVLGSWFVGTWFGFIMVQREWQQEDLPMLVIGGLLTSGQNRKQGKSEHSAGFLLFFL